MLRQLANSIQNTWLFGVIFFWLGFTTPSGSEASKSTSAAEWIAGIAFALLMALWVVRDARRRDRQLAYDFPALVFFCWPVFGPMYLFQTRGLRAFVSLLVFVAMALVGMLAGVVVGFVARL